MDKKTIILAIAGALVIFVFGGGLGVMYKSQQDAPQLEKLQKIEETIKLLSSKAVPLITSSGQVAKIDGKNITLNNSGDNLTVHIAGNAQVFSSTPASGETGSTAPIQSKVNFEDIKLGDKLNINSKLLPSGQLEGLSVIIFNLPN